MGHCCSKMNFISVKFEINLLKKEDNLPDYGPWEEKYLRKIDNLYEIASELENKNRSEKANYYYEESKKILNNELKLSYLIKAVSYNNINENILLDYLDVLKKESVKNSDINFLEYLISYGNLISLDLVKNKFPEYEQIRNNSQKDAYFNLLFDFMKEKSNDDNFIFSQKRKIFSHEGIIPNQPISYNSNKEAFFYFQIHFFFDFFRSTKEKYVKNYKTIISNRKKFLRKCYDTISYIKDNLPQDEKDINVFFFTLNFCQNTDLILQSFKTFCKKELTFTEIKNQIINENKFITDVNLINDDIQINVKDNNEPTIIKNYKQYDTYSIVEYFKENLEIDELSKYNLMKYQDFQYNNFYKQDDKLIKFIFQKYINSNIANSMFYKIRDNSCTFSYKENFQTKSFIDDLYNNKILYYPFISRIFCALTIKYIDKMFLPGYHEYSDINENKNFKLFAISKIFFDFQHEFQHIINAEISFITGNLKYFSSFEIKIKGGESGEEYEKILFGGIKNEINILQGIYILNLDNYEKSVNTFKKEFISYSIIDNSKINKIIDECKESEIGNLIDFEEINKDKINFNSEINLKQNNFENFSFSLIKFSRVRAPKGCLFDF